MKVLNFYMEQLHIVQVIFVNLNRLIRRVEYIIHIYLFDLGQSHSSLNW